MQEIKKALDEAVKTEFGLVNETELTRPDEKFGDFSTNIAMQAGKKLGKNPREIAILLAGKLHELDMVEKVEIADPGFINIRLNDDYLLRCAAGTTELPKPLVGQTVVAEYSDPNPFKVLHVGHLYTSVIGDAIANLFEAAGAEVVRVNFGGDVGLHVAKTMWSILGKLEGENPDKLADIPLEKRAEWLAEEYVTGSLAYGDDKRIDNEIKDLNKKVYQIHEQQDKTSPLAKIYWETRQWSYDYFNQFYARIGTKFEKYYPESETVKLGLKAVNENIGKVFEESDGAIVFKGEVHNMHTRVFINSEGLPTYETKDVGLIFKKWEDYHFDKSIIITGNEIYEYMQVVLKAVERIAPELAHKTVHLTHGMVRMAGGKKMSSRTGDILRAEDVLEIAAKSSRELSGNNKPEIALGAVKYAFLKQRLGSDIIYNPTESVSLEGNSGPYIQYAHARASSILAKIGTEVQNVQDDKLEPAERSLARKLSEYPEAVSRATAELMPHHITTYLYELAQIFNSFYEKNRIIGDERQAVRLQLVKYYAQTLKSGLDILNIAAPEHV